MCTNYQDARYKAQAGLIHTQADTCLCHNDFEATAPFEASSGSAYILLRLQE